MEEVTAKYDWMAPFNTDFEAQLPAILEACLWASKTNQQVKGILLKSTNIKLGWIKAHIGYSGNEAAYVLAKKATQEGIPTCIPAPRNHIKSLLQKESIIYWQKEKQAGVFTTFCLKSRQLLLHGKGPK
ncbi:hypothetical protein AVEN_139081-1 [Araneus ventricosus]|uniref:Uncharacterized protein n=1 Tax=Araneus ventricosus TaxID=182803 RepID=A0A4Y2AA48_ARAVE|nr:hypothetical protein AVEN_1541-1 [Araneus ventricosus]GBL76150.1 hypothetical protein AVEN_139081-1 [Araneus ventricosus]